ncbi:universal stress protein [Streptomyces sp. NPDC004610]|uniref:universal stress protein n=1 Tax=unclassified Streptomyces TaxID=2593676 RepID=UPI0033B15851
MGHLVVAGVDGSLASIAAADWAAREAVRRGVPLRLLHAGPVLGPGAAPDAADFLHGVGERLLHRVAGELAERHPDAEVESGQIDGPAVDMLPVAARDAGLLVVGTRGVGGFDGLAVGSVALASAAAAPCPVVLVPARWADGYEERSAAARGADRVVLGFDAHAPAPDAAGFAFAAAQARGVGLWVVGAWALPPESVSGRTLFVTEADRATWEDQENTDLSDALRPWRAGYPTVPVHTDVVLLHPAQALLNASRHGTLLVMGAGNGPGAGVAGLGPVTHAVLQHSRRPVAVVPRAD